MEKSVKYEIVAHENGWAVVISDVLRAVYPSQHLALEAAKQIESDMHTTQKRSEFAAPGYLTSTDAAAPNRLRPSLQVRMAAPYQVDTPLRRRSG